MPGYCYLCETESIGYFIGGYFCEDCDKIKKLVEFLGSTKILESVRFKMEKIEETKVKRVEFVSEKECYSPTCPSKNTRSKTNSV